MTAIRRTAPRHGTNHEQPPGRAGANSPDPVAAAQSAHLRYVSDSMPGIRRLRTDEGFRYIGADGRPIHDQRILQRITSLAIPPAWTDVWICQLSHGHLQATGRDARGRKQYRYHPRWRAVRDTTKYERLLDFAYALPRLRERVAHDLALPGLPRDKVLATVVRLLETTLIRIGNQAYVRANESFGLTTLRNEHVKVSGTTLRFRFRGKSGREHSIETADRRLARIVQRCRELPGHELFEYRDEAGNYQPVDSADVNAYLRESTGEALTAKHFRTWAGTVLAVQFLQEFAPFASEAEAKKNVAEAVESVAQRLGNTPSVCRKCYIHPAIIESYMDGSFLKSVTRRAAEESATLLRGLEPEELAVIALLKERVAEG